MQVSPLMHRFVPDGIGNRSSDVLEKISGGREQTVVDTTVPERFVESDLLDFQCIDAVDKILAVDAVVVSNHESWRGIEGKGVDDLLCCPVRVWMFGYVEMRQWRGGRKSSPTRANGSLTRTGKLSLIARRTGF